MSAVKRATLAFFLLGMGRVAAMAYHPEAALEYWQDNWKNTGQNGYDYRYTKVWDQWILGYRQGEKADCGHFLYHGIQAGFGGAFVPEVVREASKWDWIRWALPHKMPKYPLTEDGFLEGKHMERYLMNRLHCAHYRWTDPSAIDTLSYDGLTGALPSLRPGDIVTWRYFKKGTRMGHGVGIRLMLPAIGVFYSHSPEIDRGDLLRSIHNSRPYELTVIHIPDTVDGCRRPQYKERFDSTFKKMRVTHNQICCWHENLANTWPWCSDSSAYACLSWPESSGHVWDSMISPRMNFAGDSAIQFSQETYSTLQHTSGTTIAVKGSIDNGVNWPYVLGDDGLTEADLPWAKDQRNVRILWVYHGHPQPSNFWCVDDVEIWAKPTRNRDVSVSGVARPYGIISQGQTVVPAAMVWNHGKQPETLTVTMNISSGYTDTKTVMLYPYNDTLLEFRPWTATHGSYRATAFCAGISP